MKGWNWLTNTPYTWGFFLRVIVKAALLFVAFNLIFALLQPLQTLGEISLYNTVIEGRDRLPYGDNPSLAYNLTLDNIPAMVNAHKISAGKADDEFRLVLIGDSSTWGFLLETDDTIAGQINAGNYETANGRRVVAYNMGYPTMSLTKDLLFLDEAMEHEPDMMVWLVTLESFPRFTQLESPLAANNRAAILDLIERYDLDLPTEDLAEAPDLLGNTIVEQRRPLADLMRLQLYGVMWQSTGIDQFIPEAFDLRQSDFDENVSWKTLTEQGDLPDDYLAWDVLAAGIERVGDVPFLLVNEPMFISEGENSDLRYNFFYPRWVYDDYRGQLTDFAEAQGVDFLDMWDAIAPDEFTDSPVHMTPSGTGQLSALVMEAVLGE